MYLFIATGNDPEMPKGPWCFIVTGCDLGDGQSIPVNSKGYGKGYIGAEQTCYECQTAQEDCACW